MRFFCRIILQFLYPVNHSVRRITRCFPVSVKSKIFRLCADPLCCDPFSSVRIGMPAVERIARTLCGGHRSVDRTVFHRCLRSGNCSPVSVIVNDDIFSIIVPVDYGRTVRLHLILISVEIRQCKPSDGKSFHFHAVAVHQAVVQRLNTIRNSVLVDNQTVTVIGSLLSCSVFHTDDS